jgi:hypothetical protein
MTTIREVVDEPRTTTATTTTTTTISRDPQFLRYDTLLNVFARVTTVGGQSRLADRGQIAFIFEQ